MWESNPPNAGVTDVAADFEDQASHQARAGPAGQANSTYVQAKKSTVKPSHKGEWKVESGKWKVQSAETNTCHPTLTVTSPLSW